MSAHIRYFSLELVHAGVFHDSRSRCKLWTHQNWRKTAGDLLTRLRFFRGFVQSAIVISLASLLNLDPLVGSMERAVSMEGRNGAANCRTCSWGLIGGPIIKFLITTNNLQSDEKLDVPLSKSPNPLSSTAVTTFKVFMIRLFILRR